MLCQFQVYSKVNQLYIYIYPLYQILSHIGHYRVLSRVPCAIQQVLMSYLFYIQQCVYVSPNLPIYPSPPYPLLTISLFSIFLFFFFKLTCYLFVHPYIVNLWHFVFGASAVNNTAGFKTTRFERLCLVRRVCHVYVYWAECTSGLGVLPSCSVLVVCPALSLQDMSESAPWGPQSSQPSFS